MRANTRINFWEKVVKTESCWNWVGYINKRWGYGYFKLDGKHWRVHRLAYEIVVGDIPTGKQLDHLCKNRLCVNPSHLEPVTNKENVLRGDGLTAINARKTECHRGHQLLGENLYITPSGYRNCRECRTISQRKWAKRVRQTEEA